jgi:ATP-dependent Clp protease ATP-binding subunit ClpA
MSDLQATATLQHVMAEAKGYAEAREHDYIGTEHMLLAIVASARASVARHILTELGADRTELASAIEGFMQPPAAPWGTTRTRSGIRPHATELPYTSRAGQALQHAIAIADTLEATAMSTGHILAGLLHDAKSPAGAVLTMHGVAYDDAVRILTTSHEREE